MVLTCVFATPGITAEALEENGYYYKLINDDNEVCITKYVGTNKDAIIPATIAGKPVTMLGDGAFSPWVTSAVIPDSVKEICSGAFRNDSSLISVTIGNGVTTIGERAFENCTSLTEITIPNNVSSIGDEVFSGCTSLSSVTVGEGITSISGSMFQYCSELSTIIVDENNTKYHSVGNCLIETESKTLVVGCKESIIPTDGSVTKIGDAAFYYSTGLTGITIPDVITSIGGWAFRGCTGLTSITIPNSVTSIGECVFSYCTGLTSVKLSSSCSGIFSFAFDGCTSLTEITIPDGCSGIGDNAFQNCTALKKIILPGSFKGFGYNTFVGCTALETVIYCGTEERWKGIPKKSGNTALTSANISYHLFDEGEVFEPSCEEEGYTRHTCTVCGYTYDDEYTEPRGHIYSDWIIDVEPQVGVPGSKHKECTECGMVLQTDEIPPLPECGVVSLSADDTYIAKHSELRSRPNGDGTYTLENFHTNYTVILDDGSENHSSGSGAHIGDYFYNIDITCDTPIEDWEIGVPYTCTATLFGVTDTLTATLGEIESVSAKSAEVIEGYNGELDGYWDEEQQEYIEDAWYRYTGISPESVTITMKDGKVFTCGAWEVENYIGVRAWTSSDQTYENQWGIGEHTAYLNIGDTKTPYTVNIIGNPVASIYVDDLEIPEYTHGYYENGHYIYNTLNYEFTVTLKTGEVLKAQGGWVKINGKSYAIYVDNSKQHESEWTRDNTYTATAELMGVTYTFNVTIVGGKIAQLQAGEIVIPAYTHGEYDQNGNYIYNELSGYFTAVLKDGSEVYPDDAWGMFAIDGEYHRVSVDDSDQHQHPWTAGNTYQITATLLGAKTTVNVTIAENPIERIEIDNLSITENTQGEWEGETYRYYWFGFGTRARAYFKNGENAIINLNKASNRDNNLYLYFDYMGEEYSILCDISSQFENPWQPDNTYKVDYRLGESYGSFYVTVKGKPVVALEIDDIEITEYTHGRYDEDGRYIYDNIFDQYTLVMKDGSRQNYRNRWAEIDGISYELQIGNYEQDQHQNPWTPGSTHQVTASILGVECTFNVTIKESPVQSVVLDDTVITGYTGGEWDEGLYIYKYFTPSGKVIMKDQTEREIQGFNGTGAGEGRAYYDFDIDGETYNLYIDYGEQFISPWQTGNTYKTRYVAVGGEGTFNTEITEGLVASVEIEDYTVIEGINSERYWTDYDYYYIQPAFTVTLKDGTVLHADGGRGIDIGEDYMSLEVQFDQNEQHLLPGNTYEMTGFIGGASAIFNVTVLPSPIESVEIIKNLDKTVYYEFEYPDFTGLGLRIHYTDGTHQDVTVEPNGAPITSYTVALQKYDVEDYLTYYGDTCYAGQTALYQNLFGKDLEIPITVVENPFTSLTVSENDDYTLKLTLKKGDSTTETFNIIAISDWHLDDNNYIEAYEVYTDKGAFHIALHQDENGYFFELAIPGEDPITSNYFNDSIWLNLAIRAPKGIGEKEAGWLSNGNAEHFNGTVTAGNIDNIIRFVFDNNYLHSYWQEAIDKGMTNIDGNDEEYNLFTGDFIREVLAEVLAVDDVDLSLSKFYNAQDDTYMILNNYFGSDFGFIGYTHKNGEWILTYRLDGENPCTVYCAFNEDLKITKLYSDATATGGSEPGETPELPIEEKAADLDGNGVITDADAVYLLMYTFFPDDYPMSGAADFDGDGVITDADAVYLLMYTFFPEDYPIN